MTGRAWVSYGQIYVESTENYADLGECFGGQENGLCGAAIAGKLWLVTGLHTGEVGFTVELHDEEPDLDDRWEEIVEVSYTPASDQIGLYGWGGTGEWPLDLDRIDYRARYHGTGMDTAGQATGPSDKSVVDSYLLQFWPAPVAPDQVLKQTSSAAAYWHDFARKQPLPPTTEERAEAALQAQLERERAEAAAAHEYELRRWGGRLPSDEVQSLGWQAIELARTDRPLLDAVELTGQGTQRAIARWCARRACEVAQLTRIDWIRSALEDLDNGRALPAVLEEGGYDRMRADENFVSTVIATLDGRHDNFVQQAMALPVIRQAWSSNPLEAAISAIWTTANTYGRGRVSEFIAELRTAFPVLRT